MVDTVFQNKSIKNDSRKVHNEYYYENPKMNIKSTAKKILSVKNLKSDCKLTNNDNLSERPSFTLVPKFNNDTSIT